MLILATVIGGLAVGAGIIWESARDGHLWKLPTGLVLIGIVVEAAATVILFEFDEGISHSQQVTISAQQTTISDQNLKIIDLEKKIAPREISSEQQATIIEAIKPFAGMHFDLSLTTEIEPMRLLDAVENTLILAGWIEQPDTSPTPKFDRMNRSKVGIRTVAGVWVLYPKQSGPEYEAAAKALRAALNAQHLVGALGIIDPGVPSDLNAIHVWVGGKP